MEKRFEKMIETLGKAVNVYTYYNTEIFDLKKYWDETIVKKSKFHIT
jgi:hypothetical protein